MSKTNKGNIFLKKPSKKGSCKKKDMCKTRKQRRDISMFMKKILDSEKTQQENKREKQKKDERHKKEIKKIKEEMQKEWKTWVERD